VVGIGGEYGARGDSNLADDDAQDVYHHYGMELIVITGTASILVIGPVGRRGGLG
jgi:hypothetical protein